MEIRKATRDDMPRILEIYEGARKYQIATGNPNQWNRGGYPKLEVLEDDIRQGQLFVMEEDGIVGVFAFIIGVDPTYLEIDGKWLNDGLYGTIHRIASDGTGRGLSDICFDWCGAQVPNLRIDTHADNKPMQAAILRCGFTYCGIIICHDGTPRLAYQKVVSTDV